MDIHIKDMYYNNSSDMFDKRKAYERALLEKQVHDYYNMGRLKAHENTLPENANPYYAQPKPEKPKQAAPKQNTTLLLLGV